MATSAARSSSPRLATVLLALAVALSVVVGAASGGKFISNAALRADCLQGHVYDGNCGVPAPAAAVTAGGNHLIGGHQEQASASVDVDVQAPVSVGVGTMRSSDSEVRHQLHA